VDPATLASQKEASQCCAFLNRSAVEQFLNIWP